MDLDLDVDVEVEDDIASPKKASSWASQSSDMISLIILHYSATQWMTMTWYELIAVLSLPLQIEDRFLWLDRTSYLKAEIMMWKWDANEKVNSRPLDFNDNDSSLLQFKDA